jgi:hypothetical protein
MPPVTDTLCRSYLDLRWNFDPVAGTEAGDAGADRRLGSFDEESVRASRRVRAMAGAVEDLDVADLGRDRPHRPLDDIRSHHLSVPARAAAHPQPGFWVSHLFRRSSLAGPMTAFEERAVAALARLVAAPAFLGIATKTIRERRPSCSRRRSRCSRRGSLPAHTAAEFGRRAGAGARAGCGGDGGGGRARRLRRELPPSSRPARGAVASAWARTRFNRRLH